MGSIKNIYLPYGNETLHAKVPSNRVLFERNLKYLPGLADFENTLLERLDNPVAGESLKDIVSGRGGILILIEDNTRNTPVKRILPILIDYLEGCGVSLSDIEILTAPGTHRKMSEMEIVEKVGPEIVKRVNIFQHDVTEKESIVELDPIYIGESKIPVAINKRALDADVIIGIGSIVPHDQAGYTGGGKIVQPGICGYSTTAATHIAAALLKEIPLGVVENPCRLGIEAVAKRVGLNFIINIVKNSKGEIKEIVTGDFVIAHRRGALVAKEMYSLAIPEAADIIITSSFPYDIDYWQAGKGLISSSLAVKRGGYLILAAACPEGLVHNHPKFKDWLKLSYQDLCNSVKNISPEDEEADLVAASIAIFNSRIREKADILLISDGLSEEDISVLGYTKFDSLQTAIDFAMEKKPLAKVGIIPRGGDCLPILS